MLILRKSSLKKCRLLGHGHNFQKNIGPTEDSMSYSALLKLLKLRCSFGIIRLEFHWSASGKVSKRAEMAFFKACRNGVLESKWEIWTNENTT
jgi:hypothetical protein